MKHDLMSFEYFKDSDMALQSWCTDQESIRNMKGTPQEQLAAGYQLYVNFYVSRRIAEGIAEWKVNNGASSS